MVPAATRTDLNREQAAVLSALLGVREGFSCHLLEGVTGAGKTEVYLQLITDCLAAAGRRWCSYPKSGSPPDARSLPRALQCQHCRPPLRPGDAERYRSWEAARDGSAHIVIGTRSAVFTPCARPA